MKTFTYEKTITLTIEAKNKGIADNMVKKLDNELDMTDGIYDVLGQYDLGCEDYDISESGWWSKSLIIGIEE